MTDRDQFGDFAGPAQPAPTPLAETIAALRGLVDAINENEGSYADRARIGAAVRRAEDVLAKHGGDR